MSTETLLARQRVLSQYADAYIYTPAPNTWRVNVSFNDEITILGQGRSEAAAWKNAALLLDAAHGSKE